MLNNTNINYFSPRRRFAPRPRFSGVTAPERESPVSLRARLNVSAFFVTLLLQIPSLRIIYKYLPHSGIVAACFFILSLIGYRVTVFGHRKRVQAMLRSPFFSGGLLLLLLIASFLAYPHACALKAVGRGSTADDALRLAAANFFNGKGMYSALINPTTPISPGPGWVILNSLFSLTNLFPLMTFAYLALSAAIIFRGKREGVAQGSLFIVLMLSSPMLWYLSVTGYDMPGIGCVFALCIALTHALSTLRGAKQWIATLLLGLCMGAAAGTSRMLYTFFPLVPALLLFKSFPRQAMVLGLSGILTALGIDYLFYAANPHHFQPLHIGHKAYAAMGAPLIVAGGAAAIITAGLAFRKVTTSLRSWFFWAGRLRPRSPPLHRCGRIIGPVVEPRRLGRSALLFPGHSPSCGGNCHGRASAGGVPEREGDSPRINAPTRTVISIEQDWSRPGRRSGP